MKKGSKKRKKKGSRVNTLLEGSAPCPSAPVTFRKFLESVRKDPAFAETPELDFARDAASDRAFRDFQNWDDLETFLVFRRAIPECLRAARKCWDAWKKRLPRHSVAVGVDPGKFGAFVATDGDRQLHWWKMPLAPDVLDAKKMTVSFAGVVAILEEIRALYGVVPVFVEKAIVFQMGATSAFTCGRGYERIRLALETTGFSFSEVLPTIWTREMHQLARRSDRGDPKAKTLEICRHYWPRLLAQLPKNRNGAFFDGPVDALAIAGYGLRRLGAAIGSPVVSVDFY